MSKLYYSEMGHVLPTLSEELTNCQRARKVLDLPGTRAPATLYVLAQPYAGSDVPLRASVNGAEIDPIPPTAVKAQTWYQVTLPPTLLRAGPNTFEF